MKRVLITGASGLIGDILRDRLGDRYDFTGLTRSPAEFPTHVGDISDLNSILPAFEGVDAVVHMAANASPSAPWDSVLQDNIAGTYNVLEAARQSSVGSVIFASSNHAHGLWEVEAGPSLYDQGSEPMLDQHAPYQPDSLYGWSKAAGEALGRYYSDAFGVRVFNLRIGWVMAADDPFQADVSNQGIPPLPDHAASLGRACAIWLSHRDCAELIRCCLDADHIRYGVYYGISNNDGKFYDLTNASEEIGYHPQDSAPVPSSDPALNRVSRP